MALIHSCCHCLNLRRGSFLCGFYCVAYFLIFAYLSGPNVMYETILRFDTDSWKQWISMTSNHTINESEVDRSTETDFSLSGVPPMTDDQDESFGNPIVYVLSVVDFISEAIGCISSIVLIIGLFMDRVSLLIPWLFIVPFHAVIDTFMVIFIVIDHIEEKADDPWEVAMRNIPLLLLDFSLNTINIYMILCVLSQYQEYKTGRGTAAYEAYIRRQYKNEGRDIRMVGGFTNTRSGGGGGVYQLSTQNPSSQKSDIWLEDLVIEKLEATVAGGCPEKSLAARLKRNADGGKYGASSSTQYRGDQLQEEMRAGSVRFETCTETTIGNSGTDDSKTLLKPDPTTKKSPSVKSTYSSIGMEESTMETVGEF